MYMPVLFYTQTLGKACAGGSKLTSDLFCEDIFSTGFHTIDLLYDLYSLQELCQCMAGAVMVQLIEVLAFLSQTSQKACRLGVSIFPLNFALHESSNFFSFPQTFSISYDVFTDFDTCNT